MIITSKIDGQVQKEISKPILIYSYIGIVLGIPLVLAYIVFSVLKGDVLTIPDFVLYILLFLGAVLFATGIVFLFSVKKNMRNADNCLEINEYSFYDDYVCIAAIRRGERLGAIKTYYEDFVKRKECKKFFLLYPTSVTIYPIPKENLSEEKIARLRSALRIIKR